MTDSENNPPNGSASLNVGSRPPVRKILTLAFAVILVFIFGLGTWAALAPLDSAAVASAKVTVGPAIGEEFFFRGFLLRAFLTNLPGWLAVFLSALLFGAMHLNLLQGAGAGLIGLYLGFVTLRTGSIWPSVAAHFTNNLLCALFARFEQQHIGQAWVEGHGPAILIPAFMVTLGAIAVLNRLTKTQNTE